MFSLDPYLSFLFYYFKSIEIIFICSFDYLTFFYTLIGNVSFYTVL